MKLIYGQHTYRCLGELFVVFAAVELEISLHVDDANTLSFGEKNYRLLPILLKECSGCDLFPTTRRGSWPARPTAIATGPIIERDLGAGGVTESPNIETLTARRKAKS